MGTARSDEVVGRGGDLLEHTEGRAPVSDRSHGRVILQTETYRNVIPKLEVRGGQGLVQRRVTYAYAGRTERQTSKERSVWNTDPMENVGSRARWRSEAGYISLSQAVCDALCFATSRDLGSGR